MSADGIANLREQDLRAREFTHELGARIFTLRVPTEYDFRRLAVAHSDNEAEFAHALLQTGVVGWAGVTEADLLPLEGAPDKSVAFDRIALACLLDNALDLADELARELVRRYSERQARIRATRKN